MTSTEGSPSKLLGIVLWILAFIIMIGAGRYQRLTGPTYPLNGEAEIGGTTVEYEFIRSETTDRDATVAIPLPAGVETATLRYMRYGTQDMWTSMSMVSRNDSLIAHLPRQPAAGKLAYEVDLKVAGVEATLPGDEPVIIRFKGAVPLPVLLAHVMAMFLAMMIAVRAALEVSTGRPSGKNLALVAFVLMTIGGLVLGPIVQKYAFGEYWTGFPWGYDLTDNKTIIMWIAWAAAVASFYVASAWVQKARRAIVIGAAVVILGVYLIPHSLGGSQLDYEAVDRGVDPQEAIGTENL